MSESKTFALVTENFSAMAGRVTIIEPYDLEQIDSIRIVSGPQHGHLSVNPDNSLALVLSENPNQTQDLTFQYEVTLASGQTRVVDASVDVTASAAPQGWGQGNFYMLEQTPTGEIVVEHGDNHRKVHVTAGDHGLTRAEIAQIEGLEAKQITDNWLRNHPEYGGSEDTALSTDVGMSLWYSMTARGQAPSSNWLLLERGYEYENLGRLINRGASGESALHPLYVGAYGDGHDPKISSGLNIFQEKSSHVVIQNLDIFGGVSVLAGENILLDGLTLSKGDTVLKGIDGLTLQYSQIIDVARDDPIREGDIWQASNNRISGVYLAGVEGGLLRENLFDRNGWAEGYDYHLSTSKPMPPSLYNHSLYVQSGNNDITILDNIFLRGASFGAQMRSGGVIEGNTFIDNNAAVNFFSGYNYTLMLDNLVTSAGYKSVADWQGGRSIGIHNFGSLTSLIGNVVTHLADPNNPIEHASKPANQAGLADPNGSYFNDTAIYRWATNDKGFQGTPNRNIDGLDTTVLDRTTIQNFAAELLGKEKATIGDLADYLRGQGDGRLNGVVDADIINAFFREGFGLSTELRDSAATLRFSPDDRGEGMRWDNRLNWSTDDLPGTQNGDSVDLGGNRVLFSAMTVTVDNFIFGDNGSLKVTSGRLNIGGEMSVDDGGNLLQIDNAGQVWIDGYSDSDLLKVDIQGGRFANLGDVSGAVRLELGDDGQVILASSGGSFDLTKGSSLSIQGTRAKIGFDGATNDTAVLRMNEGATLSFVASKDGLGKLSEFRSGAMGELNQVTSGVRLDGTLSIDLSNWEGAGKMSRTMLLDVDQLVGSFDDLQIFGLGNLQDALLHIDYTKDRIFLELGDEGRGSGAVKITTSGNEKFTEDSKDAFLLKLWETLHDHQAPDLNVILGTNRREHLIGTDGNDLIIGNGGSLDSYTGGAGADVFYFGNSINLKKERYIISDYEVGLDKIALAPGVEVSSILKGGKSVTVYLDNGTGKNESISIYGKDLSVSNIVFEHDYVFSF